ncbi:MAG: cytochrome b/b6 domain-containing protein [Pseudomonadales bacterium]
MKERNYDYPLYAKFLHLGLAVFGVAAYLTAEMAEEGAGSTGFLVHAYLGLSLAAFMLMRILPGVASRGPLKFSGWGLFSRQQWKMVFEDIIGLLRLRVPERGMHEGMAGLVQVFGLLLFAWMGLTGSAMFFIGIEPETDLIEAIEELHEIGEGMVPLYLFLHVGAVIAHSLIRRPVWQRMLSFRSADNRKMEEHRPL